MRANPLFEDFLINHLGMLTPENRSFVRKTVMRYAKPKSFCAMLSWICYRIKNAILSLFGCSDWQRARLVILKSQCPNSYHELSGAYPESFKMRLFPKFQLKSKATADLYLNTLLKYQEATSPSKNEIIHQNYQTAFNRLNTDYRNFFLSVKY